MYETKTDLDVFDFPENRGHNGYAVRDNPVKKPSLFDPVHLYRSGYGCLLSFLNNSTVMPRFRLPLP
jgi:hypothetical protein